MSRAVSWLLLRRHGGLWALPHAALEEITARRPPRLELRDGGALEADELLGLTAEIVPRPVPRCARRYAPDAAAGLAVWHRQPVILVEPGATPPCFALERPTEEKENEQDVDEIR